MAARSFDGCALTAAQESALSAVGITLVSDTSCGSTELNTCKLDANKVIDLYGIYDPDKGDYYTWESIDSDWSLLNSNWSEVVYISPYSYSVGDLAAVVEDQGYRVVVYRSLENLPVFPGLFNPSKWSIQCEVVVSDSINIWGPLDQYTYFSESSQYTPGDKALFDVRCGNLSCLSEYQTDGSWKKLICLENGKQDLCKKTIKCRPGSVVVDLGGNNLVCVPVESSVGVGPSGYESLR